MGGGNKEWRLLLRSAGSFRQCSWAGEGVGAETELSDVGNVKMFVLSNENNGRV